MSRVKVSLIQGSAGRRDQYGWAEKSALIVVDGLARTLGNDDLVATAWSAAVKAGYDYGVPHPEIPELYLLGELSLNVVASDRVEIACTYKRSSAEEDPDYVGIRGDIVLVQEQTHKDRDGVDLFTKYKRDAASNFKIQLGRVDIWQPCRTLEFSKTLTVSPVPYAETLVGHTNAAAFQGMVAHHWLCMGCTFNSPDTGKTWETAFKFAGHWNSWKYIIYYLLDGGKTPGNYNADYQYGQCVRTIEVYGDADFASLGLPDVSS